MTRPGQVPTGVHVRLGPLPDDTAALAIDGPDGCAITVNAALRARGRGRALLRALHALAAPRPAGVPYCATVAVRPSDRASTIITPGARA